MKNARATQAGAMFVCAAPFAVLRNYVSLLAITMGNATAPQGPPSYQLSVSPNQAILGEEITARLAPGNFNVADLVLELRRSDSGEEPRMFFPGKQTQTLGSLTAQVRQPATQSTRAAAQARAIALTPCFPSEILDVGAYSLSFRIDNNTAKAVSNTVRFEVRASRQSVGYLLARLSSTDLGVRTRAAALLHRITGTGIEFDPAARPSINEEAIRAWNRWWLLSGAKLPWRDGGPGSVARQTEPMPKQARTALIESQKAWLAKRSRASLVGETRIGDRIMAYPHAGVRWQINPEITANFGDMLAALAVSAQRNEPVPDGAALILHAIEQMPSTDFIKPLGELVTATQSKPTWRPVSVMAQGLIEILNPLEVPVGSVRKP